MSAGVRLPVKIEPSCTGSAIAGFVAAGVLGVGERWASTHRLDATEEQILFLLLGLLFLIIPGIFFVIGLEFARPQFPSLLGREFWSSFSDVVVRMLFWFCGGGISIYLLSCFK